MPPAKRPPGRPPKRKTKRSRTPKAKGLAKLATKPGRAELFKTTLSPEQKTRLQQLADRDNCTKAEKIRRLITEAFDKIKNASDG